MASEVCRLHEQLSDVGLCTATMCWVSWGREFCPAVVIREVEETWQHTKTKTHSSMQAVSAALAPDTWSTEDASMEPMEDAQEAGVRHSTQVREATARGKAAVHSCAPSSSDDAKMAEQAESAGGTWTRRLTTRATRARSAQNCAGQRTHVVPAPPRQCRRSGRRRTRARRLLRPSAQGRTR
jgi:hypothetical protein